MLEAIRQGHVYSSIDALAAPAILTFEATSGSRRADMGDRLMPEGPVTLRVRSNAPVGSNLKLLSNGKTVASGAPPVLEYAAPPDPAVYRVEIDIPKAPGNPPIPWLVSNPIYVGAASSADTPSEPETISETVMLYTNGPADGWRVEKSVRSEGAIGVVPSVDGTQILLRYGLGGTLSESPYVAAVVSAGTRSGAVRPRHVHGQSLQPMRLTFEVRAAGAGDRRWGRSVYLDQTARTVTIPFSEMSPLGTATGRPGTRRRS